MLKLKIVIFLCFLTTISMAQWVQLNNDTLNDYSSIFFLNADTGFVVGSGLGPVTQSYDGVILRTLDGGVTWDTTHIWPNLMDVQFINSTVGFAGGQDGAIYKTTDMGNSWNFIGNVGNNFDFSNFYFFNEDSGLVQTFDGFIDLYKPFASPSTSLIINSPASTWFWELAL